MRPLVPAALLGLLLAGCTRAAPQTFVPDPTPSTTAPSRTNLDAGPLAALRGSLRQALEVHVHGGHLDLAWGEGAATTLSGPYADAAPEADAAALQALQDGAPASSTANLSSAVTDSFKQLDGARGGAYLLLSDAAHPARTGRTVVVDTPFACPTPTAGGARPQCLRSQVSDGLMAAWYARDTRMFFHVGETTTVYRPIDAIAVGSALLVAGFQLHDETKIQAGTEVLRHEIKNDIDEHYGLLYGLVSATAQGGHSVTDYNTRLADQAGAAELILEAFDYSREAEQQGLALKLLQPLLEEKFPARTASGPYVSGFDLQTSGPADSAMPDITATLLTLQAARHFDRDDGGRLGHLEEVAAAALLAGVEADRKSGADPSSGLPARLAASGPATRSGIVTALAVTILGDVVRQLQQASPSPAAAPTTPGPTP